MSEADEAQGLKAEIERLGKMVNELSGENLRYEMSVSRLKHELKQKRDGFSLLSTLQQSIVSNHEISSIFEMSVPAINGGLEMDKTLILGPTEREGVYRPIHCAGYTQEEQAKLLNTEIEFGAEFFGERGGELIVNRSTAESPLIARIRETCLLPNFVAIIIAGDPKPVGILLSGRMREQRLLYPAMDRGYADTLQALAGLISFSIRNLRTRALEEMDKLKSEFFANISHEFRTPITLSLGPLESILKNRYGSVPDAVRTHLEGIQRNQARLLGLVNQILDLAKLESGSMSLQAELLPDVNRFVGDRFEQFRPWAEKRGFELRTQLDPAVASASVYLDREKFDRVLLNLLSNACKFTKAGYVELSTRISDGRLFIDVTDTGMGIKADQLPHLFERFRQAEGSSTKDFAGTGLGLSLVKEIVSLHGGELTVKSEYGKGSTFTVNLPLGKEHLDEKSLVQGQPGSASGPSALQPVVDVREGLADSDALREVAELNRKAEEGLDKDRPTILYADDNRDLRMYVHSLLSEKYNVYLAVHGQDGLTLAKSKKVDLILSDLMMPVMNGTEFCKRVKEEQSLQAVPFVLLTAKTDFDSKMVGLEIGADDYLSKPFSEAELFARIKNLIHIRKQHARIQEDLKAAREIQRALLPEFQQQINLLGIDALYWPAEELSGDFFDILPCGDWVYLYVADVTSHGTASAQVTYIIKTLFQEALSKGIAIELEALMRSVWSRFSHYRVDYGVGIQICRINVKDRQLEYAVSNAPKGFYVQNGSFEALSVDSSQPLDPSLDESEKGRFHVLRKTLTPGSLLYLFTDGCFEFDQQAAGPRFRLKHLGELIAKLPSEHWDELVLKKLAEVNGSPRFADDVTMLRLRIQ